MKLKLFNVFIVSLLLISINSISHACTGKIEGPTAVAGQTGFTNQTDTNLYLSYSTGGGAPGKCRVAAPAKGGEVWLQHGAQQECNLKIYNRVSAPESSAMSYLDVLVLGNSNSKDDGVILEGSKGEKVNVGPTICYGPGTGHAYWVISIKPKKDENGNDINVGLWIKTRQNEQHMVYARQQLELAKSQKKSSAEIKKAAKAYAATLADVIAQTKDKAKLAELEKQKEEAEKEAETGKVEDESITA